MWVSLHCVLGGVWRHWPWCSDPQLLKLWFLVAQFADTETIKLLKTPFFILNPSACVVSLHNDTHSIYPLWPDPFIKSGWGIIIERLNMAAILINLLYVTHSSFIVGRFSPQHSEWDCESISSPSKILKRATVPSPGSVFSPYNQPLLGAWISLWTTNILANKCTDHKNLLKSRQTVD